MSIGALLICLPTPRQEHVRQSKRMHRVLRRAMAIRLGWGGAAAPAAAEPDPVQADEGPAPVPAASWRFDAAAALVLTWDPRRVVDTCQGPAHVSVGGCEELLDGGSSTGPKARGAGRRAGLGLVVGGDSAQVNEGVASLPWSPRRNRRAGRHATSGASDRACSESGRWRRSSQLPHPLQGPEAKAVAAAVASACALQPFMLLQQGVSPEPAG